MRKSACLKGRFNFSLLVSLYHKNLLESKKTLMVCLAFCVWDENGLQREKNGPTF